MSFRILLPKGYGRISDSQSKAVHSRPVSNFHPLSRRDISNLLTQARNTEDPRLKAQIQDRLKQGIRNIKCPLEITGKMGRKANKLDELFVSWITSKKPVTQELISRFYNIMHRRRG